MKIYILMFTILCAFHVGDLFAQVPATAESFFRQGVAAERAGDPDAAREAYAQALRLDPHHADARHSLSGLKNRRESIARQGRKAKFDAVLLPEIRLDDVNIREALDVLAKMVETQSDGEVAPNFVVQDADGKLANVSISLQLRNVSAGAVLKYMLGMANARERYDEFAIVILPH